MKRIITAVTTFLASFGLLFATPAMASATTPCVSASALKATWGCGSIASVSSSGFITGAIQDTKTDGSCVYLYAHAPSGAWLYTGFRECNEVYTIFSAYAFPGVTGVRIYRFSSEGNNYLTLWGN